MTGMGQGTTPDRTTVGTASGGSIWTKKKDGPHA